MLLVSLKLASERKRVVVNPYYSRGGPDVLFLEKEKKNLLIEFEGENSV